MPGHYASFAYSDPFADEASLSLLGGRILDDSEDDTEQEEGGPPKLTTAQLARLRELVKNMPRFYGADESGMTAAGSTDPSGMEGADVEAAFTNYFEELKAYNAVINQFLEDEGIPRFYKDDKGDTYYLNIGDPGQPSSFTDMYWTGEYDPQQKPGNYIQEGAVGLYGTRFDEIAEFNESQFAAGLKTVAAAVVGQQLGGLLGDALGGLVGAEAGGASVGVSLGSFEGEDEDVLSEEGINPYLAYLTGKTLSEEEEEEDTTTVDATQGFLNTLNTAEEALQNADDEVTTATEALQESNESYDEAIERYEESLDYYKRNYGFRAKNFAGYKRAEKLKKQAEIDKQREATQLKQAIAAAQTERDNARKAASYAEREYNESVKLKQAADQRQAEQDSRDRIMGEKAAADYLKELRDSISAAQAETVETAEVDIPVTAPEVVEEIEEDITLQIPEPIQETVTESEQEAEEEAEQAAEAVISEAAPQDIQTQAEVSEGAPSEELQEVQYDTEGQDDLIIARQLEEIIEAEKEAGNDELAAALEDELEKYLEGDDGVVQESENIFESEEFEQAPEAGQDPVDVTSILLGTVPNLSLSAGEISEEPTEELFTQGQVDDFIRTAEQGFENKLAEQQEEFEEKQAEEAAEAAEAVEQATAQGREEGFGEGFGEGQGQGRGEGAGAGLGAGLGLGLGIGLLRPGGVTQSLFENFEFKPAYQAPELLDPLPQVETPNFLQGLFRDVA